MTDGIPDPIRADLAIDLRLTSLYERLEGLELNRAVRDAFIVVARSAYFRGYRDALLNPEVLEDELGMVVISKAVLGVPDGRTV